MTSSKLETPRFTAPGLLWMENGQSILSGPMLDLWRRLDLHFLKWAAQWNAEEYFFPTFIPIRELHKLDYFRNFPQLVTFPVSLDQDEDNIESFRGREPVDSHG